MCGLPSGYPMIPPAMAHPGRTCSQKPEWPVRRWQGITGQDGKGWNESFFGAVEGTFPGQGSHPCNWLVVLGNSPCWRGVFWCQQWRLRRWTADCSTISRVFAGLSLWFFMMSQLDTVSRGPEIQSQSFASDFFRKPEGQLKAMEEVRVCLGDPWSPTVPPLENDRKLIVQWVQWSGLWAVIFR